MPVLKSTGIEIQDDDVAMALLNRLRKKINYILMVLVGLCDESMSIELVTSRIL